MTNLNRRVALSALALSVVLCGSQLASAQNINTLVFLERNPATGTTVALEQRVSTVRVKLKVLGLGGGKAYAEVSGTQSPVRFHAGQKIEFIFRDEDGDRVTDVPLLLKAESTRDSRRIAVQSAGALGINPENNLLEEEALPVTVTSLGKGGLRVTLQQPLAPGEYALTSDRAPGGFYFGIDP